ncbi:MAG: 2,3-bisphosphoglycerate-independent phosphoglycerate mutase [bacterium]|nr:2,3-bisphosphoglycerate-independent phosphoglycerate mutase [bacterium]
MIEELAVKTESKILLLVLDGVGGVPKAGFTELETASTPNLDKLTQISVTGVTDPVAPGITPGSGPAHLSLFGYDPVKYQIGRGVLEALGVGISLDSSTVAARGNFATVDKNGIITDRRAGRISTEENKKICDRLKANIKQIEDVKVEITPGKEHRFVLVLSGDRLDDRVTETDPQKVGTPPNICEAIVPDAEKTARVVNSFVNIVRKVLSPPANMVLLRGFAKPPVIPSMQDRFKLTPAAIASYPMYCGLARLVGMAVLDTGPSIDDEISTLKKHFKDYDFFYLHIKRTDSLGEDGNFDAKVKLIEEIDRRIPEFLDLSPAVFVVTGDHSTPALLKAHSWHPNPFLLYSKWVIPDSAKRFTERECMSGGLGRFNAIHALTLMLAYALKLKKFGA